MARADGKSSANSHHSIEREVAALDKAEQELAGRRKKLETELRGLEEEQRQNETPEVQSLRQRYKEQRAETSRIQKDCEKERAILETSIKRMDDLKRGKQDNQRMLERVKKDIDRLKDDQMALEDKTSQIIGKMAALDETLAERRREEAELKSVIDEDDKEVKESRLRLEKSKREVEACQEECKREGEDLKFAEAELDRLRQNYQELTAAYDFFKDLQQVEKMVLASDRNYMVEEGQGNSSMLQTSILNSSIDSNQNASVFHKEVIFKTDPSEDLREDVLESFILHRDRLTSMIGTETTTLKKMEGNNLEVITQFRNKYGHYKERLREFEAVRERQQELKNIMDGLKEQRLSLFRQGFGVINSKLKEVYQHLTRGGDAQLQLIDSLDPFSDGVNFSVRPPKKSWKEVNKLSGGQKTLSSLSLIFALHYYNPTPLYFMDEIDAALDFKNVSIVADYVKKRTKDAQFIIISLRNNMFDLADKLVGVYKTQDKTRTINLQPAKLLKLQQQKENQQLQANRDRP